MAEIYTVSEVAQILKVKESTILTWVRVKKIRASHIGHSKHIRITGAAIEEFLKSTEEPTVDDSPAEKGA